MGQIIILYKEEKENLKDEIILPSEGPSAPPPGSHNWDLSSAQMLLCCLSKMKQSISAVFLILNI